MAVNEPTAGTSTSNNHCTFATRLIESHGGCWFWSSFLCHNVLVIDQICRLIGTMVNTMECAGLIDHQGIIPQLLRHCQQGDESIRI